MQLHSIFEINCIITNFPTRSISSKHTILGKNNVNFEKVINALAEKNKQKAVKAQFSFK